MAHQQRLVLAAAATGAVLLLAACGGGGSSGGSSGSGTDPVVISQPGTPAPTASPHTSASPAATPTGTHTATPSPAPTTTPGTSATPTPPGASSQTIVTYAGSTAGQIDEFTPNQGDTSTGGQGQAIDGISCLPTMSNNYHVHAYLGVFVNGTQVALPAGVGMEDPGPFGSGPDSTAGFINQATCFYSIHIHDQSGIVHVEDTDPNNIPLTGTMYTFQNLFDEWGITVSPTQFGPFTGPVRVFTSGQIYQGGGNSLTIPATELTYYGNNPSTVPFYSHEVVFVEVGPTWPTTLPNVTFYLQF